MKKKALLIVGLALLIAAAGVVYAHWMDTLKVEAHIDTGNVCIDWNYAFTDDDNADWWGEEYELPAPEYGQGSIDPSSFATVNPDGTLDEAADRYDKAIGNCASGITEGTMWVGISNVYPSYHCTIWANFSNCGSIPVKVQNIETTIYTDMELGVDAFWKTEVGTPCGEQYDPGDSAFTVNYFHLLQGVETDTGWSNQAAEAEMFQTITFVNWNEYDADACDPTFDVRPLAELPTG